MTTTSSTTPGRWDFEVGSDVESTDDDACAVGEEGEGTGGDDDGADAESVESIGEVGGVGGADDDESAEEDVGHAEVEVEAGFFDEGDGDGGAVIVELDEECEDDEADGEFDGEAELA